jgi:hypothetical protein
MLAERFRLELERLQFSGERDFLSDRDLLDFAKILRGIAKFCEILRSCYLSEILQNIAKYFEVASSRKYCFQNIL